MSFPDPASVESAFYEAFRRLDIEQMRAVWSDALTTSCIHPGGELLQGTEAIIASWSEIFRDSQPPRVEHELIQSSVDGQLAVHTVRERVSSGAGRRAVVLATNIFGLDANGWRMLAHHASLPLVESDTREAKRPPLH